MGKDSGDKCFQFWSLFKKRCEGKTHMFDGREPVRDNRYGPLIKSIHFQCDIRDSKIEAQAYIDLCKGSANKDEARKRTIAIYDSAHADKHKIEKSFDDLWILGAGDKAPKSFKGRWVWGRGDEDVKRSVIKIVFEGKGLTSPQTEWRAMCDELIDAIVPLEEVLMPYNIWLGAPALRAGKS